MLYTFGDSILDCGHCNEHGVHSAALLVRNDDATPRKLRESWFTHTIEPSLRGAPEVRRAFLAAVLALQAQG